MDQTTLQDLLSPLHLSEILYFDSATSTNALAVDWLDRGAPDTSLIVADEQTAGRGRFDRRWITQPGAALAYTLIIRPTVAEVEKFFTFSPWSAIAVCEALEEFGLHPQIKWPNDVLVHGRKICGILAEAEWSDDRVTGLVVGTGVNVTRAALPPALDLNFPATCVEAETGRTVPRWTLLKKILSSMLSWRPNLASAEFFAAWERRLAFRDEWVRIGNGKDPSLDQLGIVRSLNPDGSLRLEAQDGSGFDVNVGEMHLRPASKMANI
jgi:BirA family transcriptional regulator, biotin operon repressor / biotin---[acetyl-CoA-carboxylase] ligase